MATKEQYEFFKSVYDEHRDRIKALESRAQLYFTIQSLYFGFVVLKFSDVYGAHDGAKLPGFFTIFQVVVALFLAFALTCTLFAVRIQRYETASNLRDGKSNPVMQFLNPKKFDESFGEEGGEAEKKDPE
jgi:hypothetical protein